MLRAQRFRAVLGALTSPSDGRSRPAGVTLIGTIFLLIAGLHLAFALLTWGGMVSLASGAFLLGGGLEIYGPVMFAMSAFLFSRAGFGLLKMSGWSRYLAIGLAALGVYMLVPAVSSAVFDYRRHALTTSGIQVIVRVAAIWYMLQEPVKDAFA